MSNDIFAKALQSLGVDPPMKISARTGKIAYAFAKTDEEFIALEDHPDVRVQALVAARLGNKTTIEETRTERFLAMSARGAFPVPLRYYGAHSGRWSGQDSINLQNLPSRGANAGKIKKAIRAPEGYVFIDCDSSQIEARTLAWLAGQTDLVQAFENKEDVYKIMASRIYNKLIEDITSSERFLGKTVILGCGYGVGHVKLRATLKQAGVEIDEEEATRIIDAYRSTYSRIPDLWKSAGRALQVLVSGQTMQVDIPGIIHARAGKGFTLPNGLYLQYPGLERVINEEGKTDWRYWSKGLPINIYGGKVVENICQAVARCIIGEQMLRIAKRYKVVLTVHDAVGIVARQEEAHEARAYVEACMSWRPKWAQSLPLACESGMGATYGDC
jgi:DNA polymerase